MRDTDFSKRLLAWFDGHGRHDMPWQQCQEPYAVWLSEIMLQQTQVDTVALYFQQFMDRFPEVRQLAGADLDEVLALWSGLGYYARARNLHKTAKLIANDYAGQFPETLDELMALPGVGRSTAGAILALAFHKRAPILDGNVKRVLARYAALDGWPGTSQNLKLLWALADRYTPNQNVAAYTQAIMDFGATVCKRGQPDCARCPLIDGCGAYHADRTHEIPAPRPKRARPSRRTTMIIVTDNNHRVLLKRRPPNGVWGGLWVFPEVDRLGDVSQWCEMHLGLTDPSLDSWSEMRHKFTHFDLEIHPVKVQAEIAPVNGVMDSAVAGADWVWYNTRAPQALGLAKPVSCLLDELSNQLEN